MYVCVSMYVCTYVRMYVCMCACIVKCLINDWLQITEYQLFDISYELLDIHCYLLLVNYSSSAIAVTIKR